MAAKQRFCCTKHRVYANREGPSTSALAATKIHEALVSHIGDLLTLANKLGQAAGEPQLVIGTRRKR